MIGPKKLTTIRRDLRRAFAATADDPIHLLEEQIVRSESLGQGGSEVLRSLQRMLVPSQKKTKRARAKK
jgi:hypothetical protein